MLGAPPPEALRRIVIEPARRAASASMPGLVDDMVSRGRRPPRLAAACSVHRGAAVARCAIVKRD